MSKRRIFCPDNVWMLSFNGFSIEPDAEPLTLCYRTREAAINDFQFVVEKLKERYPDYTWFDDTTPSMKKIAFRLESITNRNVFVETHRIRFIDGMYVFWKDSINQDEMMAWSKGYNERR